MPIRQDGRRWKNSSIWLRRNRRRKTARPSASTPCSWKTDLARSIASVVILSVDGSLCWLCSQHPTWHIAMPKAGAIQSINGSHARSPIHQRLPYPVPSAFSITRQKPLGLQTSTGLNEHRGRRKYLTGPQSIILAARRGKACASTTVTLSSPIKTLNLDHLWP